MAQQNDWLKSLSWFAIGWAVLAWPAYLIAWSESGQSLLPSGVPKDISPAITIAFIVIAGGAWLLGMGLGILGLIHRRALALIAGAAGLVCAMTFIALGTF